MSKYPRYRRTAAQQAALTAISQRSLVKAEAVAFYDALNGLPPDAPAPTEDGRERGKHYRKCHEYARVAWECFQNGTRPPWGIGRNAIYRRYEAKLEQISATYLSRLTSDTTTQSRPKVEPKPVAPVVHTRPKREESEWKRGRGRSSAVVSGAGRCVLCDDPVVGGKEHCKPCLASLDGYAALLGDGRRRTAAEIIDGLELEEAEDELLTALRSDPRFVGKDDGRWTITSKVRLKWLNSRRAS
jgi:hypothetical protein